MLSYFAGSFRHAFPLRAVLRSHRPFAPDSVCGQPCKSGSNSEGVASLYSLVGVANGFTPYRSFRRFGCACGCLTHCYSRNPCDHSEYSALSGGDFQGIGSFDPIMGWEAAQEARSGSADRRLDGPPGLGMVASLQSPPPFHLAKPL